MEHDDSVRDGWSRSSDTYIAQTIGANGQALRLYVQAAYQMATDLIHIDEKLWYAV